MLLIAGGLLSLLALGAAVTLGGDNPQQTQELRIYDDEGNLAVSIDQDGIFLFRDNKRLGGIHVPEEGPPVMILVDENGEPRFSTVKEATFQTAL